MTAKEMFEKLEYECETYGDEIKYTYKGNYADVYIYFHKQINQIEINSDKDITFNFSMKELKAINKQIEELGW